MMRKFFDHRKPISGLLLCAMISLSFPFSAFAQLSLERLAADTTGTVIAATIACNQTKIESSIKSLFKNKAKAAAQSAAKKAAAKIANEVSGQAAGVAGTLTDSMDDVTVHFDEGSSELESLRAIAAASEAQAEKATCTNAIQKAAAGVILRELTLSTVNWINHGLNGNPFYATDTESVLKSVRDRTISDLNLAIGFDLKNYPFGQQVARSLAYQLGSTFEAQSRYSLDRVIAQQYPGMTHADFSADFAIGGWDAFIGQTFLNNNPYGFNMAVENEAGLRVADTYYSPGRDLLDQLARSGGFFDQKSCLAYSPTDPKTCIKFQVQTPGSVIAHALTKSLDTTNDQLINGQDLSADITAIFDALTNQLINKGLSALSSNGSQGYADFSANFNGAPNNNATVTTVNGFGSWSSAGSNFNIFTDLPQLMRYEDNTRDNSKWLSGCVSADGFSPLGQFCAGEPKLQEGYQQILAQQVEANRAAIGAIYALDFCVPGPHPGAIDAIDTTAVNFVGNPDLFPASASSSDLNKVLKTYGGTVGSIAGVAGGVIAGAVLTAAGVGTLAPGIGTAIGAVVGLVIGTILTTIGSDDNKTNEQIYGKFMEAMFGIGWNRDEHLNGRNNSSHVVTYLSSRIKEALKMTYEPTASDVSKARTAALSNPAGTSKAGSIALGFTKASDTDSQRLLDVGYIPVLSTTNAARAKIMEESYNARSRISDLVALVKTEYPKIDSFRETIAVNQQLMDQSIAIESQLWNLKTRIDRLPTVDGYPGPTAALELVPTISLIGAKTMSVQVGGTFTDPGATASDRNDGTITSKIVRVSNVNTLVPGIYSVTYDVTNSAGIAASQVVRSVRVLDSDGFAGAEVANYAVKDRDLSSAQGATLSASATGTGGRATGAVRDYNKDYLAVRNVSDVSSLTEYELELRRIATMFSQLAPYIHSPDDLDHEEAVLETMRNEAENLGGTDGKGGALGQCVKAMTDPSSAYVKAGGTQARTIFSYVTDVDGTVEDLPEWLTTKLPSQLSFLPDWHFAAGNQIQLLTFSKTPPTGDAKTGTYFAQKYLGAFMIPRTAGSLSDPLNRTESLGTGVTIDYNKLIYSNDISTIDWQPATNALYGFEHMFGLY